MWNDSKSFLMAILPEIPSFHMHEGTSDTAHPVSKYREKHSSIFPASGKASYLAVKRSHFLWETTTYIYETSMQIPCDIQFTFLSDTKNGKLFSALYLFSWPWLCSKKDERTKTTKNPNSKKIPITHTRISNIPVPFSSSTCAKETIAQALTMEREQVDGNSDHQVNIATSSKKPPTGNKWKQRRYEPGC